MKSLLTIFMVMSLTHSIAQKPPQEITTEKGKKYLIGKIDLEHLKSAPYDEWYVKNYEDYSFENLTDTLTTKLKEYHILLFMGTWCGDSKLQVPRFIKVLESVDFPMEQLKIVTVDRRKEFYKKSPTGEEWGLDIRRVPTFIFLKNGKEVNRIVEDPIISLENDMTTIVNGENYIPNYAIIE